MPRGLLSWRSEKLLSYNIASEHHHGGTGRRVFFRGAFMPHLMNTYGRLPVAFTHGAGCRLHDETGRV
ncbi:MAG: hypothetical protein JNK22_14050, partial [Rhodocyclaceae bacterium]|nr:hypothetical protein [Rhodocyclaceae bacterium]